MAIISGKCNHPIQPLYIDEYGVIRFKQNAIVRYLLDRGPEDMNSLALIPFSDEDRRQFAQMIGYSLGAYCELSYVDDAAYGEVLAEGRWCRLCGRPATLLCDWKLPNGKTCDAPICERCSYHSGPDVDYCKDHVICDGPGKDRWRK